MKIPGTTEANRDELERAREYVAKSETKGEGCRNTHLNLLAYGVLERFALSYEQLQDLCTGWASRCDPPLSRQEAAGTINSAWRGCEKNGDFLKKAESPGGGGGGIAKTLGPRNAERATSQPAPPPPKFASQLVAERLEQTIAGEYYAVDLPWVGTGKLTKALLPASVTMLCAPPGSCKSLMMLELVMDLIKKKESVGILEMEEDTVFHSMRTLAMAANNSNLLEPTWVQANPEKAREALERHMDTLDAVGRCIYEPPEEATSEALAAWVGDRVNEKVRVLIIDPITAKDDTGGQVWVEDKRCLRAMALALKGSNTSLILVTHPNGVTDERAIAKDPMADFAGGKCWQRFTQTALYLRPLKKREEMCKNSLGVLKQKINRRIEIRKARNGKGEGLRVALWFDNETLRSKELGVIQEA